MKDSRKTAMKIIAHRGNIQSKLENSWSAFEDAVALGCHMIELDVRMASDSSLWIMHDDNLKKTSNLDHKISKMSKRELLDVRLKNGEEIPQLSAVVSRLLPKIYLNIELKEDSLNCAEQVAQIVKNSSYQNKVVISCFNEEPLLFLSKKHPELQLALLWGEDNAPSLNPIEFLKQHPTFFFHPQADYINYQLIKQAHQLGTTIYPWVPVLGVEDDNKIKLWQLMRLFDVQGLCTNFPNELILWIKKNHTN